MIDLRPRRMPAYVHKPNAVRGLVSELLEFDEKTRERLFIQAKSLMNKPKSRILKCLQYSQYPKETWIIYEIAILDLLRMVNKDLLDPRDVDCVIELFLELRNYTFEIHLSKLDKLLEKEIVFSTGTRKTILNIAKKILNGKEPRKTNEGRYWKRDIMDIWLERAEAQFKGSDRP